MYLSIIILPLLGSIVAGFFGRKVGVRGAQMITCLCVIATTILALFAWVEVGFNNIPVTINLFRWIDSEWMNINWGFQFDSLTVNNVGFLLRSTKINCAVNFVFSWGKYNRFSQLKGWFNTKINLVTSGLYMKEAFSTSTRVENSLLSNTYVNQITNSVISDLSVSIDLPSGEKLILSRNFTERFICFTDAEGSFGFTEVKIGNSFAFYFQIGLHIYDLPVLTYIKNTLGIGNIVTWSSGNKGNFRVTSQGELYVIIAIFAKYKLNSTKYINFLNFEQAFSLYINNSNRESRANIKPVLLEKLRTMDSKISDLYFSYPMINITSYWLLGFVEGDGSFSYNRQINSLVFMDGITNLLYSISQVNLPIKYNGIIVYPEGEKFNLAISRIEFIEHVIIPLFNSVTFRSKNYLDYLDWVAIFNIIKKGLHYLPWGKILIERIYSQINSNRLSTLGKLLPEVDMDLLISDIAKLLSRSSNFEYRENGRVWIVSENRYPGGSKEGGKKKIVALLSTEGLILKYLVSVTECAKSFDIPRSTFSVKLQKNQPIMYKNQRCLVQKVDKSQLDSRICFGLCPLLVTQLDSPFISLEFLNYNYIDYGWFIQLIMPLLQDSEWFNITWGFQFDALTVSFLGLLIIYIYIKIEIEAVLVLIQLYKNIFIQKIWNFFLGSKGRRKVLQGYKRVPYRLESHTWPSLFNSYIFNFQCSSYLNKLINKNMNYSTLRYIGLDNEKGSEDPYFLQWFVGFTDAEGNFIINRILKKDGLNISCFSFMFKIALHKDDEEVLRYIKDKLGVGGVRLYKDECIFNITDQKGIALLISVFDKYNLNTTKYLDYLDFKEAFLLYLNRNKNLKSMAVKDKILDLKNKMNTNRVSFDRPENSQIVITKSWLVGFIEGDGSFFLRRDTLTPVFSLENTGVQLPVFVKIKKFLENSLGFDKYSLYKLKNTSTIAITTVKAKSINSRSTVTLTVKNINLLNNCLLPFFSEIKFLTKKSKDFYDFKIICKAIYEGAYRDEEIKSLILKLSNTMNNFRLSTYKATEKSLSQEEISKLLNAESTIEHLLDGRVIDRHTKKVLPRLNCCVYEIWEEYGVFFLAISLTEAASIVELYSETLSKYLDIEVLDSNGVFVEVEKHKVRRVRVFSPVK